MKLPPGEPDDGGTDHFMVCPACGVRFDMRDLAQVFGHIHDGPEMPIVEMPATPKTPDSS